MRASRVLLLLAPLCASALPLFAQTMPGQCDIRENQRIQRRVDAGVPMIYISGPFRIVCSAGEELRALEGTVNEATREIFLSGDVFFQDPTQTLTARNATYLANLGRLYATGDVVFTNREEGSTIRGPELEYFRAMEGRPEARVNAGQRPHLTVRPARAAEDAEPMEIDADRVEIVGRDDLSAFGSVVIRRTDLLATAQEARYDGRTDELELRLDANVESERFNLSGQVVRARMLDGALDYVHARTDASVTGEELQVDAPDVQLFFRDELLQRAVARVPPDGTGERVGRAVATARSFRLEGDSIDALTPEQRVDRVVAIGRARGEAIDTTTTAVPGPGDPERISPGADTTGVATAPAAPVAADLVDRDWIVGDTIIGYFEPADTLAVTTEPADTGAVLRRIVARGMAQSLYRVEPEPGQEARGVNYLAGELIELNFVAGELQVAEVTGLRRGIYLDPLPAGTPAGRPPNGAPTVRQGND